MASWRALHWSLARWMPALGLAGMLFGCAIAPDDVPRPHSQAWAEPQDTSIGRAVTAQLAAHPGQSGFVLLDAGMDALSLRGGLAEFSERTLDLQYYTLHEDTTTQLLMYRVLRAAQRGVRVRVLIDDLYTQGKEVHLAAMSAHPHIEVRVFNPFLWRDSSTLARVLEFATDMSRLNRRMHNKLWIADNAAAIVGGRNLGDMYYAAGTEFDFADLDLLAAGPVVRELSDSFDAYWNSPLAVPVETLLTEPPQPAQLAELEHRLADHLQDFKDTAYARALRDTRLVPQLLTGQLTLIPARAVVLADPPDKPPPSSDTSVSLPLIPQRLRAMIEAATQEVILITPYFVPSDEGLAVLAATAARGVRVRVLTNSLASTDEPAVHAAYAHMRDALLAHGVELHEMRPLGGPTPRRSWRPGTASASSLHAKAAIVDRRLTLMGSLNLDPRSRRINTEVAVQVDSEALGSALGALFDEAVSPAYAYQVKRAPGAGDALSWQYEDNGTLQCDNTEPASLWRRVTAPLLWLFIPDEFL